MTLLQLYYTSCTHGLSGYTGFQFNAVSAGVDAALMREVERLTGYQRPRGVPEGEEPVNLCHAVDSATGFAITAQVVYVGKDPSGRPGNYFAHAIATSVADEDMPAVRPVELWGSAVWRTTPVDSTELPVLTQPPRPGPIDRIRAAEFVDDHERGRDVAARLVTATVNAMNGGRPVILRSPTPAHNALWLAATSYLLGERTARRMSFATYTSRVDRSSVHVAGTVPDADSDSVTASLDDSHVVIDTVGPGDREPEPHPSATLLADAGPVRAAGLWVLAERIGDGSESTLDDWYPVIGAAHLLTAARPQLPADAVGRVGEWLVRRLRHTGRPVARAWVSGLLRVIAVRAPELQSHVLRDLGRTAEHNRTDDQIDRIDEILVDRAIMGLTSGVGLDAIVDPFTARGRAVAASRVVTRLDGLTRPAALEVIAWCQRASVPLPFERVRALARDLFGPVLETAEGGRLAELCSRDREIGPAIVAGIADELEQSGAQRVEALLDGEIGRVFARADLREHPALHERMLLRRVRRNEMRPVAAMREIVKLRDDTGAAMRDRQLLAQLWPTSAWSVSEAVELLPLLGASPGQPTRFLRPALLTPPDEDAAIDGWLTLVNNVLAGPAIGQLTAVDQETVRGLAELGGAIAEAGLREARRQRDWYRDADREMARHGLPVSSALRRRLVRMVLRSTQPARALVDCTEELFVACCTEVDRVLRAEPRDARRAAQLFAAGVAMMGSRRHEEFLVELVVADVAFWPVASIKTLRQQLAQLPLPKSVVTGELPRQPVSDRSRWRLLQRQRPPLVEMLDHLLSYTQRPHDDEDDD
jgi:GTPase-associated protein 1, N-terminal domain type 2/GTPase-associated protein 1, middle domain